MPNLGLLELGIILLMVLPPLWLIACGVGLWWWRRRRGTEPCPSCAERIKREAKVCRYCGRTVAEAVRSREAVTPPSALMAEIQSSSFDSAYILWANMPGHSNQWCNLDAEQRRKLDTDWNDLVLDAQSNSGVQGAKVVNTDACVAHAPHTDNGLKALVKFAKTLLNDGVSKDIIVRGVIDCVPIYNGVACGIDEEILRNAHRSEGSMQWVGVACTNRVSVPSELWDWESLVCYPVPLKGDSVLLRPVVVWRVPPPEQLIDMIGIGIPIGGQPDWKELHKAQQTAQFGRYIEAQKPTDWSPGTYPHPASLLR